MSSPPPWAAFQDLYQIGYVATDIDRAMDLFRDWLGIPAFKDLGALTLPLDDGTTATIRIAMCFVGAVQIEIIQPMGGADGIYRDALPATGFGMTWHHFARKVSSLAQLDTLKADLMKQGQKIAISGGDPKLARFFYLDARPTLSHYIEYIYISPERLAVHASFPHY